MEERATRLLADACGLTFELHELERKHLAAVADLKAQRRRLWLEANRQGATYSQIRHACGVSDGLVCKEMRAARREHPDLAARTA